MSAEDPFSPFFDAAEQTVGYWKEMTVLADERAARLEADLTALRARLVAADAALVEARLPDNNDKNITNIAAIIADYVTPEGHDPEEWGQLCELAEKVLRKLNLWQAALHPATKEST